jgi:hypothetical protein
VGVGLWNPLQAGAGRQRQAAGADAAGGGGGVWRVTRAHGAVAAASAAVPSSAPSCPHSSFLGCVNKSLGVGIKGVPTCPSSFRAGVRAGVPTPALASLASGLPAHAASSAVSPPPWAHCFSHFLRKSWVACCRNDGMTRSSVVDELGWSSDRSAGQRHRDHCSHHPRWRRVHAIRKTSLHTNIDTTRNQRDTCTRHYPSYHSYVHPEPENPTSERQQIASRTTPRMRSD